MPKRGASRARPGYGTSRSPRFRAAFALPHTLALTFFPRWLTDVVRGFGPIATRLVAGNVHDAVVDLVEGHSDLLLCYHHPHHPVELDSDRYPMLELGAEALKVMALEGHGVAWLPDSAVVRELRDRQLALAVRPSAAAAWRGEMAIRLYRDAGHTRPVVMALWSYLANREAPGLHADR